MIVSSINMSIRTDSELKSQAEQVLSQLGMSMTVPLSLSLSSEQSLYAALLQAKAEREQGIEGIPAEKLLSDLDRVIVEAERGG